MTDWWSAHTHSSYSVMDAMPSIEAMVAKVKTLGQPALGLTDHGLMSGCLRLYKTCQANGIQAFPGSEFYLVNNITDTKAKRHHLILLALNMTGYRALVKLSSRSHQRDRYNRKPRIDLADLADMAEAGEMNHVALLTGCYFGLLPQTLLEHGVPAARAVLRTMASWCPNTYVEIQNHSTDHGNGLNDDDLAQALYALALDAGVPVMVTQDAHYCEIADKPAHDLLRQIALVGSDPEDAVYPGDSYHIADSAWVKAHFAQDETLRNIWDDGLTSARDLLLKWDLELPALDKYKFHVPKSYVTDPAGHLRKVAVTAAVARGKDTMEYLDRIATECDVIEATGMADYFIVMQSITDWCRANGIYVRARGSANGSLVCWLQGITDVDSVRWGCLFERFLTMDRTKPPDIDLDVDKARRDEVIDHIRTRFDIAQIANFNTLALDAADRGSIMVKFMSMKRRSDPDFIKHWGGVTDLTDVAARDLDTANALVALSKHRARSAASSHAAGYIISAETLHISDYVPTMLIPSSGKVVTQMTMDDIEDTGYMKGDFLGLRNLSTWVSVCGMIDKDPWDDTWIPERDQTTMKMLRKAQAGTVGVFQLEGYTAANGCKELPVRTLKDVIAIMALYRPACIDSGAKDAYKLAKDTKSLPEMHPLVERHLTETYGIALYQDQVVAIMRDLGMAVEDLNKILKAVKQSNQNVVKAAATFRDARANVQGLCHNHGMTMEQIGFVWNLIQAYADYGFNRAHATAYGLFAYRMAYVKAHYPLEFMAASLATTAGTDQEKVYLNEARKLGCKILGPDVSISGVTWTLDVPRQAIRRGLLAIPGIGPKAAVALASAAPYTSMEDLLARTPTKVVTGGREWDKKRTLIGVMAKLQEAGALGGLGVKRTI